MHYERFELPNGLRILVGPMPSMRSATTAVFINVGSRWETAHQAGVAHLIEHLLFKGTRRRPSSKAIAETIERVGGVMNASTDKEATVYWTKTAAEHVGLSIDLLADMLQNSRLTPAEIARERTVIVEELGMSMDDPQDWVHSLIDRALWGDHPLGRDVAGTRESVQTLTRRQIREFMAAHYGPNNAILVVTGGIEPQRVHELAQQHFGDWKPSRPAPCSPAPPFDHPASALDSRGTEQLHLCMGYPGLSRYDPDRYALDVLMTILGGSTTSRLFLEVRERVALAYDVHVYSTKLADSGALVVYAGVDPTRAQLAISAILSEIERMRRRLVPSAELQKTLDYLKGRLYLGLEDTHAVASWLGSQELLMDRIESPEAVVAQVERVQTQDIRRLANELFRPERMRLAAIGPGVAELAEGVAA